MATWIPNKEELETIKHCAVVESGCGIKRIVLEPGCRLNIKFPGIDSNINILRVTRLTDDSWDDTDLDYPEGLDAFTEGVELTEDGRAIVDFYIQHKNHGLFGNITVYYSAGEIQKICGYGDRAILYAAP